MTFLRPPAPLPNAKRHGTRLLGGLCALLLIGASNATADPGGRIVATGGTTSVEGSAGGGIVPWAVLSGYGQQGQFGGAVAANNVKLPDFSLQAFSVATTFKNRVEFSFNHQNMNIGVVAPGEQLKQKTLGVKVRLAGELIWSRLPQVSLGVQYKENETFDIPSAVGADDDSGVDLYLAASKLWLAGPFNRTAFLNGTVRATRANQMGLLGFGGDLDDDYSVVGEASAGLFLNRNWVLGVEYRQKPNNLSFAREDDWYDAFVGWFPNKRFSAVAAWSRLGSIAGFDDQDGVYLSVQFSQ